mmetsp:Transcript_66048/g.130971  ORF Transcript_66048/g.130971 Transcript_66048/m.130971 type:complete len:488 (-) Transcript_66048:197-1660(-)|eukprot:CAMPEP_0174709450 /NCGR_PEP_ID=MMETSP1094-20130205/11402_1 /TAXON_ID=156173 /ORGANISM="Chrysochromulina brevifilum, Strain UTEX LB 985" /LENGTH=487 /DNA_ID=CAMNT_0015908131 /DNA_START=53 /DNA_END=1516 /DNA_ORIENTATION=+
MAGLFAVRALRAGRAQFDPFGEKSSSEDEGEDNLDDVSEAGSLTEEDMRRAAAPKTQQKSHWEYDAAEVLEEVAEMTAATEAAAAANKGKSLPPPPPLSIFQTTWETPCELIYEDDDAEAFCVRWSPDDSLLACGCGDGIVRIYHGEDGRLAYNLEREGEVMRMPITCLRWRPATDGAKTKNVLLAANADGTVCHWHVTSRKCLHTISEEKNQVYALDFRADGSFFASAGKDYSVRVYDEATKSVVHTLCTGWIGAPSGGHSNRIFSVKFDPEDPQVLYSGGWDNTVQIWDLRTSTPQASFYGPHMCGDGLDAHGHEILTGSWRPTKQLQIWDSRTRELLSDVPFRHAALDGGGRDACHLYAAQFSKPNAVGPRTIVAGGSGSNELRLFAREGFGVLGTVKLPRGVYGLDMSHDGSRIAVAGGDCKVRVLGVPGATVPNVSTPPPPAPPVGDGAMSEALGMAVAMGAAPLSAGAAPPPPVAPALDAN